MPSTDLNLRKNNEPEEVKQIEPFDRKLDNNFFRNSRRVNFCYNGNPLPQDTSREIIPEFKVKVKTETVK